MCTASADKSQLVEDGAAAGHAVARAPTDGKGGGSTAQPICEARGRPPAPCALAARRPSARTVHPYSAPAATGTAPVPLVGAHLPVRAARESNVHAFRALLNLSCSNFPPRYVKYIIGNMSSELTGQVTMGQKAFYPEKVNEKQRAKSVTQCVPQL